MDQQDLIRSLKLQLRVERTIFAVIAVALLAWWASGRISNSKTFILVDGRPVACVQSAQAAQDIIHQVKANTKCNPNEIGFREDVVVARAPRDAQPTSRHKALRNVERALSPIVPKWAIIVNGRPVVALPSRTIAGETLDLAKLRFGKLAKNLMEEPQFKQDVTVDIAPVNPAILCRSADEAVRFLFDKQQTVSTDEVYSVRSGDIAGSIAKRYGITLRQLAALNPTTDLNRLQIGDRIRIKGVRPAGAKLTVIVRDQSDQTEEIPAPVQQVSSAELYAGKTIELAPGRSGLRKVKVATIYENGIKTGSEVVSEEIVREPSPRRIAIGIKPR